MKAQRYFGGTKPKDKATKSQNMGVTGNKHGGLDISQRTRVKQANVPAASVPKRKLPTNPLTFRTSKKVGRPHGKERHTN